VLALLGVRDNQHFATAKSEPAFWTQLGDTIPGGPEFDEIKGGFGTAVATSRDGLTIVVAGPTRSNEDGDVRAGYAKIFRYNEVTASWDLLPNGELCGEDPQDLFGESVTISGDGNTVAIGTSRPDSKTGEVRVFRFGDSWAPLGPVIAGDAADDEHGFAISLSNDGRTLAVGAPGDDNEGGTSAGYVRIYRYLDDEKDWRQIGQDIVGSGPYTYAGWSVELSKEGSTIIVGGPYHINNDNYAGRARVLDYDDTGNVWNQVGGDLLGEYYDEYGIGVSISDTGRTVAISAGCYYYCGYSGDFLSVLRYDESSGEWVAYGPTIFGTDEGFSSPSLSGDGNTVAYASYANANFTDASYGRVHVKEITTVDDQKWLDVAQNIGVPDYVRFSYGRFLALSKDNTALLVGSLDDNDGRGSATAYTLSSEGTPAGCVDSELPVIFNGKLITCRMIRRRNLCERAGEPGVQHCPKTCGGCFGDNACADSPVPFKFNKRRELCDEPEYCADESYALTCRNTCFNPMCDTLGDL